MRSLCYLLIGLVFSSLATARTISVAVAGGFKPAMQDLKAAYEKKTGDKLAISYASVGMLYAEITQNAPFDVFISADVDAPKKLEKSGLGVEGTRFTHSRSRLVLWSPDKKLVDKHGNVLKQGHFTHLAIPNPKVGAHGKTAVQAMKALGVYPAVKPKLVEGKNALQTMEYMETGVAQLGFISYSLIYHPGQPLKGSYWIVPSKLYSPMIEQAILLSRAKNNAAAKHLLQFIHSKAGQAIIARHGYLM